MTTAPAQPHRTKRRATPRENDGWHRSGNGNPYINRRDLHATIIRSEEPDQDDWILLSKAHGHQQRTSLGPGDENTAKRRAEKALNIASQMRDTRLVRCSELVEQAAKANPEDRGRLLDAAAALASRIAAELRDQHPGNQRSRQQARLDSIIADGAAVRRNAPLF